MIDLYFFPTPNGHKVTMFLEEAGVPYRFKVVSIVKGEQFAPEFLAISPNNRIPAIVDHEPGPGYDGPVSVFESGAILLYLAEKTGKLLPGAPDLRLQAIQWLFWQVAGLGPMSGQMSHFASYALEKIDYAIKRYGNETNRLYGVLNRRLADREFLAVDYSIADIACYPWIVPHQRLGQDLANFPHLKRWFDAIAARPSVKRAYDAGKVAQHPAGLDAEARRVLHWHTAASAAAAAQEHKATP